MESKVNYTVVGIFVVVLSVCLIAGIMWLTTFGQAKLYRTYWVYVQEDVTGLSTESPVRFNGVKVGYVESIHLDSHNSKLVTLVLRIQPDVNITTSTYAILNAQGITGVVNVNLKAGTEKAPPLLPAKGDPYPVIPSRPSFLMQLSTVLPEVTKDIQKLSASVADVLNTDNRESIHQSLKNIKQITQTLADNTHDFTQTIQSLDNTMANISEASNRFPEMLNQLNKTLTTVDQLSAEMKNTSHSIGDTMRSGRVAINGFSQQVLPNAQQTLLHLNMASTSLQQFIDELQRNPSMLVRGREPAQPGPGEG